MCIYALAVMPLSGCGDTDCSGGSGGSGGNEGDGGVGGTCPEQNYSPSIVSQPGAEYPLNEIGQLDLDDPVGATRVPLEVIIRDSNIEQVLEYRTFLNSPPPPAAEFVLEQGEIDPTGFVERPVVFAVPADQLDPGICHKIELVVVGEFASLVEPRLPVEEGDIHEVAWWIEVTDADNPIITEPCR